MDLHCGLMGQLWGTGAGSNSKSERCGIIRHYGAKGINRRPRDPRPGGAGGAGGGGGAGGVGGVGGIGGGGIGIGGKKGGNGGNNGNDMLHPSSQSIL